MVADAREADRKRRRAEALRANLKRRKAANDGHRVPSITRDDGERGEVETFGADTSDRDTRGN